MELAFLYREDEMIVIETDTGNWGRGETVEAAIGNLKESAAGEIFLDTADYLLVDDKAVDVLSEISEHLKGTVRICMAERGLDLQAAARYLAVHEPKMKLEVANNHEITEKIKETDGQIFLR